MITLHIEDTRIRLMLLDGKQVVKVASLPLEPGLVENGEIIDKATISRHISELMASQNIADKQVITGIAGIHSMYSAIHLPHLTKEIVAEAARREMDRVMAVPLADLYTAWQAVDISSEETVLCLVGVQRNTVDAMLETLRLAGLHSISLDITPLALARVADEKDAIIMNVQPTSFDIVVMKNGIPELLRSLPFPSGGLIAQDKVSVIKEELDRTITFYNSGHMEYPINADISLFISGEMRETLVESLGYRSKPLPNLLSSQGNFDINEYTINAGLALREIKDIRIPLRVRIDTTPGIYRPKPRPLIEVLPWAVLALVIIILVPFAMITQRMVAETSDLAASVYNIEGKIEEKQTANALLKLLQANLDAVKAASQADRSSLDIFKAQHARVNGDLAKITSLLPGTINPTSISYGDTVLVKGNASDKATILNYTRDLRNTGRFTNVIISDMHEIDYNQWGFILTLE